MKITVILTSYNHENFIRASIESIIGQTYQKFEFIIVDDCSSDSSWEIICQYKKKYPEIITMRHDYNWGNGIVEDIVKNYATGDYIAIHHSDDIWEKDKLQKQVDILESNPKYAAVFTNAAAINDAGEAYSDENGFYYNLFSVENRSRHEWLNYFFYKGNCLCHPSILIKKDVYMEDGFFRKGLRQIPDFVKWIQVCKKHEIYILPESLVKFRVHNDGKNTSGMRADTQMRSTVELFLMLNEYLTIRDKDEFLKIFPHAEKYCTNEFFSIEYVLGRICTEEGMPSYTRLFGDQLLYGVLNNPQQANLIETECHYTKQDYISDNGRYDIFGILPKAFDQIRTLYYDFGRGFCKEDSITEKYIMNEAVFFEMSCKLELQEGQKLLGLRFDPAENVMIQSELDKVTVNGEKADYVGENALCSENGIEMFINLDPIYNILFPENIENQRKIEVVIEGRIKRLSNEEISGIVTKSMYDSRALLHQYQEKCAKLDRIQSTKAYKIARKFFKIKKSV